METPTLLPCITGIELDGVTAENQVIVVRLSTVAATAACPLCGCHSRRVHSRYGRTLTDIPWNRITVRLHLRTRKFFCDQPTCERKVFTEPVAELAARYARKTVRLSDTLLHFTYLVGGEAAARIARLLGLLVSPDGLLKQLKKPARQNRSVATPRVLGIDDFAFRKGYRYGTLLVDLEQGKPIDLLPDREPVTVEKWSREHPGIEVISRDRSMGYAGAIRQAAPKAMAVADRFHIMKNLIESLEKQVAREYTAIRQLLAPQVPEITTSPEVSVQSSPEPVLSTWQDRRRERSRHHRFSCWEQVHELSQQGHTQYEIAKKVGIAVTTIRRYLRAPTFAERRPHACPPSKLDAFQPYLLRRWQEGCCNASQLYRELGAQGFTGCATMVRDYVKPWRNTEVAPTIREARRAVPSVRTLAWLLLPKENRSETQTQMRQKLIEAFPALEQSQQRVQEFRSVLRGGTIADFDAWLAKVHSSNLTDIATFARGLQQDRKAVEAAITETWSNGPVEGQVNRLKFVKRQGYGRASFDLLKARVLPLAA